MGNVILKRPELVKMEAIWKRTKTLINADEEGYKEKTFCFRLPNETAVAYHYRNEAFPSGFLNPTIELLTAPASMIFGADIREQFTDENGRLAAFSKSVTQSRSAPLSLKQFLKDQFVPNLRGYGTVFMVVDMPPVISIGENEQREARIWPYLTILDPLSVVNYEMCSGELLWFAYSVSSSDSWLNPLERAPKEETQERIWTRSEYVVRVNGEVKSVMPNPWGFVPVIVQACFKPNADSILGISPFAVSSNMIIKGNNILQCASTEIEKNASSLLLWARKSIGQANSDVDREGNLHLKQLPDGGAMTYEGDVPPSYLSRDLAVIAPARELAEFYFNAAIENEKNAASVGRRGADGNDLAQSGISDVIGREPIVANIINTAIDTRQAHIQILEMANKMINGVNADPDSVTVEYDMEYDITPLSMLLENATSMKNLRIPSAIGIREIYKKIVTYLINDKETLEEALAELDEADVLGQFRPDADLEAVINGIGDNQNGGQGDE